MKKISLYTANYVDSHNIFVGKTEDFKMIMTSQVVAIRLVENDSKLLVVTENSVYLVDGLEYGNKLEIVDRFKNAKHEELYKSYQAR